MRYLMCCAALLGFLAIQARAADPPRNDTQHASPQATQQTSPHDQATGEHQATTEQTRTAEPADGRHPSDPNFRWHNGRWWYWQNGGYLMWNGSRWINESERGRSYSYAPSYGTRRSYSYVPTEEGMPRNDASGMRRGFVAPDRVEYQKVLPSFGIRSAGSKILGNY